MPMTPPTYRIPSCRGSLFIAIVFLILLVPARAGAETFVFETTGAWSASGSWRDGRMPQAILHPGDEILIACGAEATMRAPLRLQPGSRLHIAKGATLRLLSGSRLDNAGSIDNDGILYTLTGLRNAGMITNAHHITNEGGRFLNEGTLHNLPGALVRNTLGGVFVQQPASGGTAFVSSLPPGAAVPSVMRPEAITAVPPERGGFIPKHRRTAEERAQDIEDRWLWEFDRLKDPKTGTIPRGIRQREYEFARTLPQRGEGFGKGHGIMTGNSYTALGPNNLGGRSRAFAFDVTNSNTMIAGGVSSGIFRSSNGGGSWTNVTPSGQIHNVTALAQDPRSGHTDTWYYGTGEALGNSASATSAFYLGQGIFKSTDNGLTWAQLASTSSTLTSFNSPFDLIHRLAVDPTNGYVYAAAQWFIVRSTDGGATWNSVLGTQGGNNVDGLTDIVITSGGRLYAAFTGGAGSGQYGVWTSTSGDVNSWTRIASNGMVSGWNTAGNQGRVVLALAPSNENILYALYDNEVTSNCGGTATPEAELFRYDHSTTTWTDRSANLPDEPGCSNGNDPFAVQGGYNLAIAVKPNDPDFVVIGGTNAYRSTDGFATTANTTRIGGYAGPSTYALYANHHPDIHVLAFDPNSSSVLVSAHDGGISSTSNVAAGTVSWTSLNNDFVTYQYYYATIDPTVGTLNAIGGAQDNGTTASTGSTSFTPIWSGDGVAVGISENNTYQYVGSQNGQISRRQSSDGYQVGTNIKPSGSGTGMFITCFHLDPDNTELLWYASASSLYRTTTASTVSTSSGWTQMTGIGATANITAMATSRGVYQSSHRLYIGTSSGQLRRLDDPANASASTSAIGIGNFTGNISGIAVDPTNDAKVLVALSNYGVTSIYYSSNATAASPSWTAVEGNLTLPSVRSCAIIPRNGYPTEYYVGTSIGLYSTAALNGASTVWAQEGTSTLGYAVVSSLALRPFDNRLLLGTHGNGMFYTDVPNPPRLPREWRGGSSATWTLAANWSHGAVPGSTDDVLLPATGVTNEASITSSITLNDLTIAAGRTLTVAGVGGSLTVNGDVQSSGTLQVDGVLTPSAASSVSGSGSLTGSGTVKVTRTGSATDDFGTQYAIGSMTLGGLTVEFSGAAAQKSATSPFGGLTINNSAGVQLQGNTTVAGVLTLQGGLLTLGSNHLTLGGTSTVAGLPSASNMVVATGSGELRKVFTGTGSFVYPVGDADGTAEYSPATLDFTSGTFTSAHAGVRVVDQKHPQNTSASDYLTRYWTVTSSGITGFSASAAFQYVDADVNGSESSLVSGKYDGSAWSLLLPVNTSTKQLGGVVTSFSDFTAGEPTALPVELVLFTAHLRDDIISLRWRTATELNNFGFEIEASIGTGDWQRIGFVPGAGTSAVPQEYRYQHALGAEDLRQGRISYRLCQLDRDGTRAYSPTVSVQSVSPEQRLALLPPYPNPAGRGSSTSMISFFLPSEMAVRLTVYDLQGRVLSRIVSSESFDRGMHSVPFDTALLSAGSYIVELFGDDIPLRRVLRIVK